MTFLELCKRLRQEAGISGTGPASVVSQTGELKRIVDWILSADQDVQNKRKNWKFLQNDFSFNTVAGTQVYSLADVSLTELATWKRDGFRIYLTATGTADEQRLTYCDWDYFKDVYLFGGNRSVSERPMKFTIKPDKSIAFWPNPDAIYTCAGEYFKRAQAMTVDSSEPLFPEEYHMLLVWMGLISYAEYEGAQEAYSKGMRNVGPLMAQLEADQLPATFMAGALA